MKQIKLGILLLLASSAIFTSCSKSSSSVSQLQLRIGTPISSGAPLCGAVKGYMKADSTYTVSCPIFVPAGDTLEIQSGVTLNVKYRTDSPIAIAVQGVFLSLGTKANPITITSPGITKTDNPSASVATDPAYQGYWCGILGDTSCKLMVIKWTHVEFTGQTYVNPPFAQAQTQKAILFQNPNGVFVMEDSWIYGSVDDPVRLQGGLVHIVGNTVEKTGPSGGDVFNAKHGTVGIMAYNMFIGVATNGTKASDKGTYTGPVCQIDMYNNTYVNSGYRQVQSGRGACLNYEQGAFGQYYNNLVVNCRFGPRVVPNPAADTADMHYGYSFQYGDQDSVCSQFYPQAYVTHPQASDIPSPSSLISNYSSYVLGGVYDGGSQVSKNNPMFKNFTLPTTTGVNITYATGFDFHLSPGSPAIGKGNTSFTPHAVVNADPNYGASELTTPGIDMGCYQSTVSTLGNQH